MSKQDTVHIVTEFAKELGRYVFFAVVAAVIAFVQKKAGSDPTTLQYIVYTLIGRQLDQFVHNNDQIKSQGIAPF